MEDPVVDKSLRLLRLDKRHKMAMMTMRMSTKPEMKMVNKEMYYIMLTNSWILWKKYIQTCHGNSNGKVSLRKANGSRIICRLKKINLKNPLKKIDSYLSCVLTRFFCFVSKIEKIQGDYNVLPMRHINVVGK